MTKVKLLWLLISIFWQLYCVNGNCADSDWTLYNDEKCFKVFESEFDTNEQGVNFCTLQLNGASLLTIKSLNEQLFLEKLIFDDSNIVDNVWLGAKRIKTDEFFWTDDNSRFEYTKWAPGSPSNNQDKECVQMVNHPTKGSNSTIVEAEGFWSDVSCLARKIVVCQTPSTLNLAEIQRVLLETRKVGLETREALQETRDDLLETRKIGLETREGLLETKKDLLETKKDLLETKEAFLETNRRVLYLENNPVPVGFIYIQLANQPTPSSLWPLCNWTQVTSDYAGLFFRAEGGNSATFGSAQAEDSPRFVSTSMMTSTNQIPQDVAISTGVYSNYVWTGIWSNGVSGSFGTRFLVNYTDTAKPEVRPVNSAVRIWIRTA